QQSLEKRLARYALAGSALLGVPAAAHAGIIYSGTINSTAGLGQTIGIDIDGGGNEVWFTVFRDRIRAEASPINFFNDRLSPLTPGSPITLANTGTGSGDLMKSVPFLMGPWANQSGFAYLGLKFTMSSQEYLGWAQISIDQNTSSITLRDYAYNDVAGDPI